jgi:membrane-associated phospholipid phosphatase
MKIYYDIVGFWAPAILVIMVLIQTYETPQHFWYFLATILMNLGINKLLKHWVKEPRPCHTKQLYDFEDYENYDNYGMPSGHAQVASYTSAYYFFLKNDVYWLIGSVGLTILTMIQRWKYKAHSVEQLVLGSLLGIVFAYIFYYGYKYYVQQKYQTQYQTTIVE